MLTPGVNYSPGQSDAAGRGSPLAVAFAVFFFTMCNIQLGSAAVPISILLAFIPYLLLFHRALLSFLVRNKALVLYPTVVLASSLWSAIPMESFSGGVQLGLTICVGIIVGLSLTQSQLVASLFMALSIVVVISILSGRMAEGPTGMVLVGVTGSKDAMGYAGMTLFCAGLTVIFDGRQSILYRYAALLLAPVGAYVAFTVQSAAPEVGSAGFAVVFFVFLSFRYFNLPSRLLLALAMFVGLIFIYLAMPDDAWDLILRALNKDSTLTGRVLLWNVADQWIAAAPEIGHGFRAFWLGNSTDSLGLLHNFQLVDGRTFQFHHTIREILVDCGWLGLLAFLITLVVFLWRVVVNVFTTPTASGAFVAAMYFLLLARIPLETIILVDYTYTILFYACGTSAIVASLARSFASTREAQAKDYALLAG